MKRAEIALCLLLGLLAACSSPGPSYIPCPNGDSDCPANATCIEGECRPAAQCQNDTDCGTPRVCLGGYCRVPECVADTDCTGTDHCTDHACVAGECRLDTDCQSGSHCENYACVANECATDNDCQSDQECDDGRCVARDLSCQQDSDCRANELCLSGLCSVAPSCTVDDDCPQGTVCEGGTCARPCTSDTDCASYHVCRDGHCRQRCLSDATCMGGLICEDPGDGVLICVEPYCQIDTDCQGQYVRCTGGRCETYTPCPNGDSDCPPNFICQNEICEELPLCAIDNDCRNQSICQISGCVCTDGHCHPATTCLDENDCEQDEDCVGGMCVPFVCRGADDCPTGQVCSAGVCVNAGDPNTVYEVIILTPGGPILSGQSMQLEAIALKLNGDAIPGIIFDWNSTEPQRAAVDTDGLLTGGAEAGDTLVTATAHGSNPPVVSDAVVFTNQLPVEVDKLRVTVVERLSRDAVAGATVLLDTGSGTLEGTTDQDGVAIFDDPIGAVDIHVFSAQHDYLSMFGVLSRDVLAPVPLRSNPTKAGGFTGQMTFSGTGEVSLGLAGASIGGQLVDLNFTGLLGDMFTVIMEIPGVGSYPVTLPGRMVAALEYSGIPFPIKPTYYVEGQRGLRTAWGLGGKMGMDTLQTIIGAGSSPGEILARLLPYFAMFNHGLKPRVDIFPIPHLVDTADIDGDGDTTEMQPDWLSFQGVNLSTNQEQTLAVLVSPPAVPSGISVSSLVLIAGSWQEPQGITPLGLTSQSVGTGGVVEPLTMKLAPVYGGLESGRYMLAALAMPGASATEPSPDVCLVVFQAEQLPTEVDFPSGFLHLAGDASWSAVSRLMTATAVADASIYRSTFESATGRWEVYLPAGQSVSFVLPAPPAGMDDPTESASVTLDPVALQSGLDFDGLVSFGSGADVGRLDLVMTASCRHQL